MDWFLEATAEAAGALRREISSYLRRHAADPAAVDRAELALGELLGNVVRHAAGPAWVTLDWSAAHPLVVVRDLGPGFTLDPTLPEDPYASSGRGLFLAARLTRELTAANRRAGGSAVRAELDLERLETVSFHPTRRGRDALPAIAEAGPDGFGKEAFLRALVVELARSVDDHHGPAAAEAAVAQAGIDIGGQMEAEFRGVAGLREDVRLLPGQLAACLVRLKHAIDGGFVVLDVTHDRIVLGNTRCPFGTAVQKAPSLCRMTSAVFGGIAADNVEREAYVVLEERIAVGDPGCRVVVYLDRRPPDLRAAHHYPAPQGEPEPAAIPR